MVQLSTLFYFISFWGVNVKWCGLFFKGSVISCHLGTSTMGTYMPSLIKFIRHFNTWTLPLRHRPTINLIFILKLCSRILHACAFWCRFPALAMPSVRVQLQRGLCCFFFFCCCCCCCCAIGLQGLFRLYTLYFGLSRDLMSCVCVYVRPCVLGARGGGITGAERVLEMAEM